LNVQTDFLDAHERHWVDAERLYAAQRWANADHLYGMAAECGLKALSEKFKCSPLVRGDFFHIMEPPTKPSNAWDRYESYRSGHTDGAKYLLPPQNPFTNWDVSQRYAHQSCFDQAHVDPHRLGAELVQQLIKKARDIEGLI
jgi:hypothetical protein